MKEQLTSIRRANAISTSALFLGLAIISFRFNWWPSIIVVVGIYLAIRQYLLARYKHMAITLIIFLGIYITSSYNIAWNIIIPVLFTLMALMILYKEFVDSRAVSEEETEEDLNAQIEEDEQEDR